MGNIEKGNFFVVEGTDGSGKATQIELLKNNLEQLGARVAIVDFPQYYSTFFGAMVGQYLRGEFGGLNDVDPHLSSLLYAGDRWQAKDKISSELKDGKTVLGNRYTGANMAYQTARIPQEKREEFLNWLEELEYKVYGIPREDVVVFLHVPVEIGQELLRKKAKREYITDGDRDMYEKNVDYQKKVEEVYFRLLERNKHWVLVECCNVNGELMSVDEIQKNVLTVLKEKGLLKKPLVSQRLKLIK